MRGGRRRAALAQVRGARSGLDAVELGLGMGAPRRRRREDVAELLLHLRR